MATILIADDEISIRKFLSRVVEGMGHRVLLAENGKIALNVFESESIDLSLVDVNMPDMDGIQYLEKVKEKDPDAVVIVMTGFPSAETIIETIEDDGYTYITKPLDISRVKDLITHGLEFRKKKVAQ